METHTAAAVSSRSDARSRRTPGAPLTSRQVTAFVLVAGAVARVDRSGGRVGTIRAGPAAGGVGVTSGVCRPTKGYAGRTRGDRVQWSRAHKARQQRRHRGKRGRHGADVNDRHRHGVHMHKHDKQLPRALRPRRCSVPVWTNPRMIGLGAACALGVCLGTLPRRQLRQHGGACRCTADSWYHNIFKPHLPRSSCLPRNRRHRRSLPPKLGRRSDLGPRGT